MQSFGVYVLSIDDTLLIYVMIYYMWSAQSD